MNLLFRAARRMQDLARLVPERWQLPLRYRVQQLVGGLEPEFALLPRLAAGNRAAIDVGANMGVYTYALSRLAADVHAVEPQAGCCRTIAAWARGRGNVHVHNIGAGSRPGQLTLQIPQLDGRPIGTRASFVPVQGDYTEVQVQVTPLDDIGVRDVGFIKIDAEGFERDVLDGARRLIERDRPNMLIEIDPVRLSAADFAATFDAVEKLGYRGHYLEAGQLVRCNAGVQQARPDKYNFIFKPDATAEPA